MESRDNVINYNCLCENTHWAFFWYQYKGMGFHVVFKVKLCAPDKTKHRHLACVLLVKIPSQQ